MISDDSIPVNKTEQDFEYVQNKILIRDAWKKAEDDVSRRKQTEFLLWSKSMKNYLTFQSIFKFLLLIVFCFL